LLRLQTAIRGKKRRKVSVMDQQGDLQISIERLGPEPEPVDEVLRAAVEHPSSQEYLSETRNRLLWFELLQPTVEDKADGPVLPDRYRATTYDYTNNRVVLTTGRLDDTRESIEVSEAGYQPLPNKEEFDEAVEIIGEDYDLGPAVRAQQFLPYRPMPPLVDLELPDGRVERTVAVGLLPQSDELRHEIVGVNMIHRTVSRFENRAPERALAADTTCGLPPADQSTTFQPTAGQFQVTITRGGTTLWSFLVVRPAASSGTNGSGVELQNVMYRGKLVLFQAHAPILNVQYDDPPPGLRPCGPFRDWQFEEGMIQADGTDVAPGIRRSTAPAQTILESGTDTGNFLGVAIYRDGQEVVVVSEMEAGWYRYISRWRFHDDGTIRPRFGFSAVDSSCVCEIHHHHVYWRFDFDIGTAQDNVVREFNSPPIVGSSNWHAFQFEAKRRRNPRRSRRWQVRNSQTGDAYDLIPGANDGVADDFGRGDVWILRYNNNEIDDGVIAIGPPYEADIDRFVNGEEVRNQDVVVWYGAHFSHDVHEDVGHVVGPVLRPVAG
jgi:hypothetical protein